MQSDNGNVTITKFGNRKMVPKLSVNQTPSVNEKFRSVEIFRFTEIYIYTQRYDEDGFNWQMIVNFWDYLASSNIEVARCTLETFIRSGAQDLQTLSG